MSSAPADQAQRDRIHGDLESSLLVEAAAGTGKTTSMVGRMVALLAGGRCRVENLAAVTFTRKAAAELRTRFQLALEKALRGSKGNRRTRLEAALADVDLAFIGTIHSFCARLLRERPVEAGIDPGFEELDEKADGRLRQEAWDLFCAGLYTDDPENLLGRLQDLGLGLAELRSAYQGFLSYPDVDAWPVPQDSRPPDLGAVRRQLIDYVEHMRRAVRGMPQDKDDGKQRLVNEYHRIPVRARFLDLNHPPDLIELLSRFGAKAPPVSRELTKEYKGWAKAERPRWEQMARTAIEAVSSWRTHRYAAVIELLGAAREVYDRLRSERGLLNFQDLLMSSAGLLKSSPRVRRYFRRRFSHLLVDEFQDTDPIQAEVLLLLTAGDESQNDYRKCRPAPGCLFVVGDPKQSIYRFRRADIVTYSLVKKLIGRTVQLSTNFRCAGAVLEWVNRHFVKSFPQEATDCSPAWVALEQGRHGKSGRPAGVFKLTVPADCRTNEQAVAWESDRITRTIRAAVDQGASPADFLIVTRNRANLSVYAKALSELGVPSRVTGGSALNEVRELSLLHRVLKAVVHPENPVALLAALRSEVFGIPDTALYDHKRAGGRFNYQTGDPQAFHGTFGRLREYDNLLRRLPPVAAVERIASDLGLVCLAASGPAGPVQAGSLLKALEVLRGLQAQLWSSADLVAHLEVLVNSEERYDGISALSVERPAVRIMNLHQVKGLEAPVVFLADPSGESSHDVELHIDRSQGNVTGYLAILGESRNYRRPVLAHPEDWEARKEAEGLFQQAESERLRYVAATRAASQLIITQREHRSSACPWHHFAESLSDIPELSDPGPVAPPPSPKEKLTGEAIDSSLDQIENRLAGARQGSYEIQSAKDYALGNPAPSGLTLEELDDQPLPPEIPEDGEHGVEWGTAIHSVLEVAMKTPSADLTETARAALAEQDLDESLAESAVSLVRSVMKSEIWARAQKSPACHPEAPFRFKLKDSPPTVLRGIIDLVFKEDNHWVLVDYKTDQLTESTLPKLTQKYAPQLEIYAQAWSQATGEPVNELGLYFTRLNRYQKLTPRRPGIRA